MGWGGYGYGGYAPYVSAEERRRRAAAEMDKLRRAGHPVSPVVIEGRAIAKSFWGKAWCENLEGYADFASRLERGRTYARNGSVVDLQIAAGKVQARVAGSELYRTTVTVTEVPAARWDALRRDCAGGIDSLVELLQGRLSKAVMERICRREGGLFPAPREIAFDCSCPDMASMCKHVAAVLYGIGARLDHAPELLFTLRAVDHGELIAGVAQQVPLAKAPTRARVLKDADLAALFGLDLAMDDPPVGGVEEATMEAVGKAGAKAGAGAAGRTSPRRTSSTAREPGARMGMAKQPRARTATKPSPTPTSTPSPTATPSASSKPRPSGIPKPSPTPKPSPRPSASPTPKPSPKPNARSKSTVPRVR